MPSIIDTLGGGGGASGPANLKPEPIEGNSLTQYLRSVNNRQGQIGEQAFGAGTGTYGQGSQLAGLGASTYQAPLDYWSAILSGDKTAQAKAIGPYASTVGTQFNNASRAASTVLPRGGFRSAVQAELPTQKSGMISQALLGLQPQAAQQIQGIAGQLGGLGLGIGQLGLGEQGLGAQFYQQLLSSLLQGRQQDVTEHGQAMNLAGQLGSSLISKFVPGFGSLPSTGGH